MSVTLLHDPGEILALVSSKDGAARDRLTLAMADMCAANRLSEDGAGELVRDILCQLAREAARDVRLRLAQKLAAVDWAPRQLINELAHDEIDVADAVLARSAVLVEDDLIDIARTCGPDHRIALARRPDVSQAVTDEVAAFGEPDALTALMENASAEISRATFEACARTARDHTPLHRPLVERAELPPELAQQIIFIVGEELREAIVTRFDIDTPALDRVVRSASQDAVNGQPNVSPADVDARALVERLAQSDRLTPDVVVRAVSEERLELFEHAAARLAGVTVDELRGAFEKGETWAAALACRAAGVDRGAFASIHAQLAAAGRLPETMNKADARAAASAFTALSREGAMDALRRLQLQP